MSITFLVGVGRKMQDSITFSVDGVAEVAIIFAL